MTSSSQNCLRKLECLRAVCQRRIDAIFFFVIFPPVLLVEVIIAYLFLLWWGGTILRTILLIYTVWSVFDPAPNKGMQLEVCVHCLHIYSLFYTFWQIASMKEAGVRGMGQVFSKIFVCGVSLRSTLGSA